MIKLKNGLEIKYEKDFDVFFKNLLDAMILESHIAAEKKAALDKKTAPGNEFFLKELMDNCIYVTHQLFEISKQNEELSKFMVTGFIFNSIVTTLPHGKPDPDDNKIKKDKETVH